MALLLASLGATPLHAQNVPADVDRGRAQVGHLRRALGQAPAAIEDSWRELTFRGRPSIEFKGKLPAGGGGRGFYDFAVLDRGARRLAVYIFFPNASRRRAGEAILPISEVSTMADALLRSVIPDQTLALEGIQRYRASGEEAVYYEVSYAPQTTEIRYLRAPVRLLLDAMTGRLFRFDADPDWFDPPPLTRNLITRQAAERIAAVSLKDRDLSRVFGPGARFGKVVGADLYYVHPNDWLGFASPDTAGRVRVAWLVGFTLAGVGETGLHSLFVDAGGGRVLGGMPGSP